jgi:arylsulfatase
MSDALVELYDLAPTCLELGQAESPGKMTAKSLVPLLRGETTSLRDYQISEMKGSRMIFDGRYKMIEDSRGPSELYDLEADPKELRNLVEAEAERAQRMSGVLANTLAIEKDS